MTIHNKNDSFRLITPLMPAYWCVFCFVSFAHLDVCTPCSGVPHLDVVLRMNEGYGGWGELKSVLSNRGLGIKAKKCLYEGVIVQMALYGAEAWGMRSAESKKVNVLR